MGIVMEGVEKVDFGLKKLLEFLPGLKPIYHTLADIPGRYIAKSSEMRDIISAAIKDY